MRKVKLYIATSLDGKIAKADGDVSWLEAAPNPEKSDFGYGEFVEPVDTILMGNKTYQQVMGFDIPWPYGDKKSIVFTRNAEEKSDEHVQFVSGDIAEFVREMKKEEGGDIWLMGGGEINQVLLEAELVDELLIFIMPVILGEGVPLVNRELPVKYLQLDYSRSFPGGVVELRYSI